MAVPKGQPDIRDHSILAWILGNGMKSEKGEPLDFRDRLFLLDILTDWSSEIVIKKCSQVGGSVIFNLKVLFAVMKMRWSAIYTFPSDNDVREFVASKTNKLIGQNKQVFGDLRTDNIESKEIDGRFLFFKGLNSDTASIMTSADLLVHDEASRSNQQAMETMRSRSKGVEASKRRRWMFSNPTTEKDLIDEKWHESDRKEWQVTCKVCQSEHPLSWPLSIDKEKKIFQCQDCKAPLSREDRRTGKWKAMNPGAKISGYHISHLMCPWITAEEILKDSEGDQEYFHNFVLGEPYSPGDLSVTRSLILDAWTPRNLESGEYFLGVDVGSIKHYVLGSEKGIIKVGKFSLWSDLDDLMKRYDPTLVIDAMPDNTMSKHFVSSYRKAYMCYLNRDKDQSRIVRWGEKEEQGVIHCDRNRFIDQVIDKMLTGQLMLNVASDNQFREYIEQCTTLRRVKEINNLGIERYVWESTNGNDHFFFATMFFELARLTKGSGAFFQTAEKPQVQPIVLTSQGFKMNLEEYMEERENNLEGF